MEFMLIWEWLDEYFTIKEQRVDFFATKEELLEAKALVEEQHKWLVASGQLILSAGVNYSWADLERLF